MIVQAAAVPPMERYEVNEVTGCWLWLGYINKDGYARLNAQNAHRVFYETHVGPVPNGFDVDHRRILQRWSNPKHLEAVSEIENLCRSKPIVTYQGRAFQMCREGHEVDGYNRLPKGNCRLCENAQRRAKRAAS